ncbi:helix-turn-helix transcriptional regulator [Salegentibacter sp. F188]|uniref:Helix-turn-helix transcriptional regulator n=1 Tax=Autumnicola patrickiae TaxID=3075591 RepID=A0ABU3E3U8_9FLAO|nr:helix-turn-helix transcriptional regulator [Salegentibacter sp. F188]MDT0690602.1 helix-turn-helix transcriptional regulator [Salegentibacter sp. F188]
MVNTDKFASRLNKIIKFYDLSAASFADKIEVGRSSISHILSGRNKPSLDFVMKVVKTFPEVELYWLLNGKGSFPKEDMDDRLPPSEEKKQITEKEIPQNNQPSKMPIIDPEQQRRTGSSKAIKKIVIFYEDGTFDAFEN